MSEIGKIFNKAPQELTPSDVDQIIEAYKAHMDQLQIHGLKFNPKTGLPKRKRKVKAKVDPAQPQLDLEGEGK